MTLSRQTFFSGFSGRPCFSRPDVWTGILTSTYGGLETRVTEALMHPLMEAGFACKLLVLSSVAWSSPANGREISPILNALPPKLIVEQFLFGFPGSPENSLFGTERAVFHTLFCPLLLCLLSSDGRANPAVRSRTMLHLVIES
jgi:hypothetical protein